MYLEFYGLKEKPFSLTPDPQFLFLSESHKKAIDYLLYGIEYREGFMVITGQIGTGKTTICRALLERLDKKIKTAVIFNSFLSEGKLLESIVKDFGITSKGVTKYDRINALNQFLLDRLMNGENAVLIIDEAQNLSIKVLEQIRMLSNLETDKEKMLQIILLGQLELEEKLRSSKLKQLNQRISIRYQLSPLNRKETEDYIYQRLMIAGSNGHITFSKTAIEEIYKFSHGVPRLINLICDRSLIAGFINESFLIDKELVKRAEKELEGNKGNTSNKHQLTKTSKPLSFFRIFLLSLLIFSLILMLIINFDRSRMLQWVRDFSQKNFEKAYYFISGNMETASFNKTYQTQEEAIQRKVE